MNIPDDYPPNSEASRRAAAAEKDIRRVTSSEPVRRKKGLRKQFSETFVKGNMKMALDYAFFDVMIPAARDMIVEFGRAGINKYFYGDTVRRGSSIQPPSGPYGRVSYNSMYQRGAVNQTSPMRAMSRQARASFNFDEIVLESRAEAETVIEDMFEAVSKYGEVSVADLYVMVGIQAEHTDTKWGWTDLRGAGVTSLRGGYLLDLPEPRPLYD